MSNEQREENNKTLTYFLLFAGVVLGIASFGTGVETHNLMLTLVGMTVSIICLTFIWAMYIAIPPAKPTDRGVEFSYCCGNCGARGTGNTTHDNITCGCDKPRLWISTKKSPSGIGG